MAVVAATLANGGRVYRPYLYARRDGARAVSAVRRIPYGADAIELVRKSMKAVVDTGTGRAIMMRSETEGGRRRRFRLKVDCAGKTGTAEIGRGETRRKNTWIIAFAPYDNPVVALAMLVERGESGGKTVAPRVNRILSGIFGEEEVAGGRPTARHYEGRD
jgi:cell division protein FtsI/penicillin-binding protein 2